jgi:hypothetical protein
MNKILIFLFLSLFFISCHDSLSNRDIQIKFDNFIGYNISTVIFLFGSSFSTIEIRDVSDSVREKIYNFDLYGATTNRNLCIESVDFGNFCIDTIKNRNIIFRTTPSNIILSWCIHN